GPALTAAHDLRVLALQRRGERQGRDAPTAAGRTGEQPRMNHARIRVLPPLTGDTQTGCGGGCFQLRHSFGLTGQSIEHPGHAPTLSPRSDSAAVPRSTPTGPAPESPG